MAGIELLRLGQRHFNERITSGSRWTN